MEESVTFGEGLLDIWVKDIVGNVQFVLRYRDVSRAENFRPRMNAQPNLIVHPCYLPDDQKEKEMRFFVCPSKL